jgi:hypothetical protein
MVTDVFIWLVMFKIHINLTERMETTLCCIKSQSGLHPDHMLYIAVSEYFRGFESHIFSMFQ